MQCESIIAGEFVKKVTPLIDGVRGTLDMCVFDWRWYPNDVGSPCQVFNQAVVQAVRRGVKVRAIVNNEQVAGQLRAVGVQVRRHLSKHLLHLKMMLLDQSILITGSHNYTQSAFSSNYEMSLILSEGVNLKKAQDFFNSLWQSQ